MKITGKFRKSIFGLIVSLVCSCTGLTGCAGRETEFLLAEDSEERSFASEEEADGENSDIRQTELETKPPEAEETPGLEESGEPSAKGQENNPQPEDNLQGNFQEIKEIYVDVCGAVAAPGVYAMEEGSRVFQAIEAAGGYLPEAAQGYVNRARGLSDGEQIYIPTEQEAQEGLLPVQESVQEGGILKEQAQSEAFGSEAAKVNLNTADEAQLTALTGIGASKARAIIAYREENGGFSSIEDIMKVQGIKEGTFVKIKDDIAVE